MSNIRNPWHVSTTDGNGYACHGPIWVRLDGERVVVEGSSVEIFLRPRHELPVDDDWDEEDEVALALARHVPDCRARGVEPFELETA